MISSEKLVDDHWNYIKSLLETHDTTVGLIDIVEFHYRTAFVHGFKHGVESVNGNS